MRFTAFCAAVAATATLLYAGSGAGAAIEPHRDPDTGLLSWYRAHPGFSIELIQVVPDYVRASYESRGLPKALAEQVARRCVFGTIVRNTGDSPLTWRLADWYYVTPDGARHPMKPKSAWVAQWREAGVAFRWTLLPDSQTFAVGDWGQGFTTYDVPHGGTLDLHYAWTRDGETHRASLDGLRCAPEDPHAP